jgi:tight adherence protein B
VSALLAFAACALGVAAAAQLTHAVAPWLLGRTSRGIRALSAARYALLRLGREGREPGALERRQLLAYGAGLAFCAGAFLAGPLAGAILALAAPTAVSRALRTRRLAYRRAVERDAPAIAVAVADALAGGHSLRGAVLEAAGSLGGAGGAELRRVAAELRAGEPTELALDGLRLRCAAGAIDAVVAASLVHRRSGGDLAGLLRGLARAFEDQQRLADEVRVATAQARFTGLLVVALPTGGAVLAELASPGFAAGLASSPLTAWLVGLALALQAGAALLIRRLGRVRT